MTANHPGHHQTHPTPNQISQIKARTQHPRCDCNLGDLADASALVGKGTCRCPLWTTVCSLNWYRLLPHFRSSSLVSQQTSKHTPPSTSAYCAVYALSPLLYNIVSFSYEKSSYNPAPSPTIPDLEQSQWQLKRHPAIRPRRHKSRT